jgi:hypothetical protein
MVGEIARHLVGALEEELVCVELPVVRIAKRVARLDAEQRLVRARILLQQVVDVAGGDQRQAAVLGQLCKLRIDPLLHLDARVLHLDVGRITAEELDEPVEVGRGI